MTAVDSEMKPSWYKDPTWTFKEHYLAEAEAPIFWPPDGKSRPVGKDPDAGKDGG